MASPASQHPATGRDPKARDRTSASRLPAGLLTPAEISRVNDSAAYTITGTTAMLARHASPFGGGEGNEVPHGSVEGWEQDVHDDRSEWVEDDHF